jgi:hypothetical protein
MEPEFTKPMTNQTLCGTYYILSYIGLALLAILTIMQAYKKKYAIAVMLFLSGFVTILLSRFFPAGICSRALKV